MPNTSPSPHIGPPTGLRRFGNAVLRRRFAFLAVVDAALWAFALPVAAYARVEFEWSRVDTGDLALAVSVVIAVHLVAGFATGLYLGRRKMASFEEVGWVAATAGIGVLALLVLIWVTPGTHLVPRSSILAAGAYEIVGALAFRFVVRVLMENRRRSPHARTNRVIVFGAGNAGEQAVRAIREDTESDLLPLAFLDDDPLKARLRLAGLPIEGGRDAIASAAARHEAGTLLIAMPSVRHETILDVADRAQQAGLIARVLPRMDKFLTEPVQVKDIRDVTLADFLSRDEVRLDLDEIAGYVQGNVVLVTGAGGSVGSELCDVLRRFEPARLLMLDHSENNLHALQLRLDGRALLTSPDLVLVDIRDRAALDAVFAEHRPQVVFHAAAHKHVTFLERHPEEAVKTNVFGTLNVLSAAAAAGVARFVNISTDKAADPVNVLGLTKRVGERLTAQFAADADGVYMSVRFGNVLGSDGSVIPTFREQIAEGKALTITDPEVTRYFMTIPEAVSLVVQAGALGGPGEALVLEMGEPVKIVDLAYRLAAEISPGVPPEITYTGLRDGEKLHEVLEAPDDDLLDQPHEMLSRYRVPPLAVAELDALRAATDAEDLQTRLIMLVGVGDHAPGAVTSELTG
ncbi:MAG: polysaccharide biosynthesis protein [Acidimicrobiia bacterium]